MSRRNSLLLIAIATSFSIFLCDGALADGFPVRLPKDAPESRFVVVPDRSPDPHRAGLMGANLIEGTSFAVSGARGSLAVGLMFGPLGVLANQAAVANTNSERGDRLGGLVHTDLNALLRQLTSTAQRPSDNVAYYELEPMVVTKFRDPTHFSLECYLFAYTPVGERWGRGNFHAYGEGEFDSTQSDTLDAAATALSPCLQEVYAAFVAYVDHRGEFTESARVRVDGAGPRTLHFLRTSDGQHIIFNNFNVVRSFRTDAVEFVN